MWSADGIVITILILVWYFGISWWISRKAAQSGMSSFLWPLLHVVLPVGGLLIFLMTRKYTDPLKRDIAKLSK